MINRRDRFSGFVIFGAVFSMLFAAGCGGTLVEAPKVSASAVEELLQSDTNVVVLDVRTPAEFSGETGHLANAILVPVQELEERIAELEPYRSRTIVAYCRSGRRGDRATLLLQSKGFQVMSLEGGIIKWNAEHLPVVKEEAEPVLPVPTPRQRAWQDLEFYGFLHFTVNTFTDKEWGYGDEPESIFNPTDFDADEIVRTARDAGMTGLILTCKHHDGFCLWPSAYTEHSVKNSPWKNGKGDVVKEISDACRTYGLKFGVYLSPWDRNHKDYGTAMYIAYYRNQLRELLTNYGDISEIWFDGANGGDGYYGGAREKRVIDRKTYYDWETTWKLVRDLQPDAVMFSDVGPDIRWVGNEQGFAGETCWSLYSPVGEEGGKAAPGDSQYREGIEGHQDGRLWLPAECDVSIRPGWFYHPAQDSLVKSGKELFHLYLQSVGRNASLLLNVPPDRRGRIHERDRQALMDFKKIRDEAFAQNMAAKAAVTASNERGGGKWFPGSAACDGEEETYWATDDGINRAMLTLDFGTMTRFNCVVLQEHIALGQRVEEFLVETKEGSGWKTAARGTTIGHKRILTFPAVTSQAVRITILKAKACPTIAEAGVFNINDDLIAGN